MYCGYPIGIRQTVEDALGALWERSADASVASLVADAGIYLSGHRSDSSLSVGSARVALHSAGITDRSGFLLHPAYPVGAAARILAAYGFTHDDATPDEPDSEVVRAVAEAFRMDGRLADNLVEAQIWMPGDTASAVDEDDKMVSLLQQTLYVVGITDWDGMPTRPRFPGSVVGVLTRIGAYTLVGYEPELDVQMVWPVDAAAML